MTSAAAPETIHATCVAIGGRGILIGGGSGLGKSDLALRLIDRGATLIADDYTLLCPTPAGLVARAPATIAGRLEVRGLGILDWPSEAEAMVALHLDLDAPLLRLPDPVARRVFAGLGIPSLPFDARPPSAPIKAELALRLHGLAPR